MGARNFQIKNGLVVDGPNKDSSIIDGVLTLGSIGNISGTSSSVLAINSLGSVNINLDTNTNDTGSVFKITEDGTDFFVMDNDGKVGIGTDTPNRLVEIEEQGSGAAYLRLSSTNTSYPSDTIFGGIEFYNADASGAGVGATIDALSNGSGRGGYLQFRTDENGSGSPSVRMTIDEDGNVGIGTTSPSHPLHIDTDVTNPALDTTGAFSLFINQDLSGSSATGGDREQGGIFVDVDSSTTGGDTGDEHRAYGVWADVRLNSASDSDLLYGVYGYAEGQRSLGSTTGTTTAARAGYFIAVSDETSDYTISELTGAYGYASLQDSGTVSASYGIRGLSQVHDSRTENLGGVHGGFFEIDISAGRTNGDDITLGDSEVVHAVFDHNCAASGEGKVAIGDAFLFRGVHSITDSSQVTTAHGVYIENEDSNYFSGKVGIGTDTPTGNLDISAGGTMAFIGGADISATTRTNDTRKFFRMGMPHYHNAEEPFNLLCGDSSGTQNKVIIGGGTSLGNAATDIVFNAAANDATTTGTTQANITSSGLQIGSGARVTTIDTSTSLSTSNTTLSTTGAIKAYVDANAGGGSPGGSDTFVQYNNGGSFGATTLAYTDTSGAEQYKIDVSSSVAPFVIVQTGTGNAFEVHDDTDPDNNRFEIDQFGRVAVQGQAGTNSAALYAGGVIASASRIRSAAGSASNLAFSTTGDTNTGMYFPAADNLGFSTGGTERLRFDSSGKVGIGTSTPMNKLQVSLSMADGDDGILIVREDTSTSSNDVLGGIGFDSTDGNVPSSVTEAAVAIVAKAREDHSTGDKGGYMEFRYSPTNQDDDSVTSTGMTFIDGKLAINNGGSHPLTTLTLFHTGSDFNDGLTIIRNDTSVSDGDLLGAIGFDAKDGNAPSRATEASAGIAAFAAEDHSTGDKGGDLTFFTSPINQDDDTAAVERMRITSEGQVIIGDTPNFTSQHDGLLKFNIQGTDAGMLIEKHDDSASGGPALALYRYSATEEDGDLIGQVTFRGEGSTGNPSTYMMMRAEILDVTEGSKDGQIIFRGLQGNSQTDFMTVGANGVRNMIGSVVAVASNTTLTDEESGSYVYWTGGTLTLPSTAIKGQQFVVINNKGSAATPVLGGSNAIASGWTTHAAMDDETARTYIAVAANTWIYIG